METCNRRIKLLIEHKSSSCCIPAAASPPWFRSKWGTVRYCNGILNTGVFAPAKNTSGIILCNVKYAFLYNLQWEVW